MVRTDTETSRQTVQDYLRHLERDDYAAALALFAPDATYTVLGSHPLSGTYHGQDEIAGTMLGRIAVSYPNGLRLTLHETIADNDRVVALVGAVGDTSYGHYENNYAWVFTIAGERISNVVAYADTALIEHRVFGRQFV